MKNQGKKLRSLSTFGIDVSDDDIVKDVYDEWKWAGMPEFKSENVNKDERIIIVHLKTEDDVQEFAKLVNQPITPKTKYINFPDNSRQNLIDWVYVNDE